MCKREGAGYTCRFFQIDLTSFKIEIYSFNKKNKREIKNFEKKRKRNERSEIDRFANPNPPLPLPQANHILR